MKKLSFLFLILSAVVGFFYACGGTGSCRHNDCSGTVYKRCQIGLRDKKSNKVYQVPKSEEIDVYINDERLSWQPYTPSNDTTNFTSTDVRYTHRRYESNNSPFQTKGIHIMRIVLNGVDYCKVECNLIASECCDPYPETVTYKLLEGDATLVAVPGSIPQITLNK
jgi:hypothetical protein